MSKKRGTIAPDPDAKRVASERMLPTLEAYRELLVADGQTLASEFLADEPAQIAKIDVWIRGLSAERVAMLVQKMMNSNGDHDAVVTALLTAVPTTWLVDNKMPFVLWFYTHTIGKMPHLVELVRHIELLSIEDICDAEGDTLLHYAVERMDVRLVRHLLLDLGCCVRTNKRGMLPLMAPFLDGTVEPKPMEEIIRCFHAAKQGRPALYDPNSMNGGPKTILGMTIQYPYPALVKAWLDSGECDGMIDAYTSIQAEHTAKRLTKEVDAIFIEYELFRTKCLRALAERIDDATEAVLMQAIANGMQLRPSKLSCGAASQHGLFPVGSGRHQQTYFIAAVLSKRVRLAEKLLEAGAPVGASCVCGANATGSPLYFAAREGNVEMVKLLLRYGASVNVESAAFNLAPIVPILRNPDFNPLLPIILPTIDVNAKRAWIHCQRADNRLVMSAVTLLAIAISRGNSGAVSDLIAHGAIVNDPNSAAIDLTALEYAFMRDQGSIGLFLIEKGATVTGRAMMWAATIRSDLFEKIYPRHFPTLAAQKECFASIVATRGCDNCHGTDPVFCSIPGFIN